MPVLPFSLRERSGIPEGEGLHPSLCQNSVLTNGGQFNGGHLSFSQFLVVLFSLDLVSSPLYSISYLAVKANLETMAAICGWIADCTPNRSVTYFTGLFILGAATLLFGIAKAAWLLVISRLLQGLSAAIVYTVGLALLVDTVGRENIGQWMGTALSSSSFGLIMSPLLGGIVYHKAGYEAVFGMALGLITIDIGMRMLMIEKRVAERYLSKAPIPGITVESRGYSTFTEGERHERGGHDAIATDEESAISGRPSSDAVANSIPDCDEHSWLINGRGQVNNTKPKPRMGLPPIVTLLSSPRLLAALYCIFVNVSILATFDGVLALFVKTTFHWNSLNAGLIFLCIAVPALGGPLVGILSDRFGPRWITVSGCALTTVPLILMRFVENDSIEHIILLCGLLFLCGRAIRLLTTLLYTF